MHVSTNPPAPRRTTASWHAPAVLGLLLLLVLAVWVRPVRIERAVTDAAGNTRMVTAWDTSRWQAVSAYWWQSLLLTLAFMTVVWVVARVSAARFFAASLLVHCLLVLSVGTVPLARAVVEQAEIIRVNQAVELFDEPRAGGAGERPAY